jgi:hypothetical protein
MGLSKPSLLYKPSNILSIGWVQLLFALIVSISLAFGSGYPGLASSTSWAVPQPQPVMPRLADFIGSVRNDRAGVLVGVYAPGALALPIVQQPAGNPAYVSNQHGLATQFSLARDYGSVGLLAHNTHSGADFFKLKVGQEVILVFGDGKTSHFRIQETVSFQALSPRSPYSNFIDLSSGGSLSAAELFLKVYAQPGKLIFQTCIEANGNVNWGRLFIVAEPYQPSYEPAEITFAAWAFPD